MYGPIGASTGLTGPERQGVYVDVPLEVAGLFNQGLAQFWGFNPTESCRNFDTAARRAPDCALCQWGIAVCNGPNLQLHTSAEKQLLVNAAARRAQTLARGQPTLSAKSKRLIAGAQALITDLPDAPPYATRIKYAHAMCEPMEGGVRDADIDAICGGATMSISPWNYYQGTAAGPGTFPLKPEMVLAKERLLSAASHGRGGGPHPLAIHYMIHFLEPTNAPPQYRWEALPHAMNLFNSSGTELVPSQGHLTHMPAHLFLRVGKYHEAVTTSRIAQANNRKYTQDCLHPQWYAHDVHMLIAGALLSGESGAALEASRAMQVAELEDPEEALIYLTFGMFKQLLALPLPPPSSNTPRARASYHYAQALARWALGDNSTGDAEAAKCLSAIGNSSSFALPFAQELKAARAWRVGRDAAAAIEALAAEAAAIDSWNYYEPPGEGTTWYYPVRRCLGFLYLEDTPSQNASKALEIFNIDLNTFVNNSFSLRGASQALVMLGRAAEAEAMQAAAEHAWRYADVPLPTACPQLA